MVATAETIEARKTTRLDVRLPAGVREPGSAQKFEVDVIDLSMTGLRFETSFTLKPGAKVFMTFPGMASIEVTIAWARKFVYGGKFDTPLHGAVFDHIAGRFAKK